MERRLRRRLLAFIATALVTPLIAVDGQADSWDAGALRGNFNQLPKLKKKYPNLNVLWSFGGWTWSGGFTQAAQNPSAFADSCYKLVEDPRWADVFHGIDIGWEYPNACGLSCAGPQNLTSGNAGVWGSNRMRGINGRQRASTGGSIRESSKLVPQGLDAPPGHAHNRRDSSGSPAQQRWWGWWWTRPWCAR